MPLLTPINEIMGNLNNTPENFQGGQLALNIDTWKSITSDPFILEIASGSIINFIDEIHQPRPPFPLRMSDIEHYNMTQEVSKLEEKWVVKRVEHCEGEFISTVFLRDKKDGSFRLILNLKDLNHAVEYQKFKMETIKSAITLITPNCLMASVDWKDAYFTVPIHPDFRKYLRFEWGGQLYEFQCFVNGLSEAPRKFTKLTKPLWGTLRNRGHVSVSYIDDALLIANSYKRCIKNIADTLTLSDELGFTIHPRKCHLTPSHRIEFLGFNIDSNSMTVTVTNTKKETIKRVCTEAIGIEKCKIRFFASIIGKLVATQPGVPHAPLFYRELEFTKTHWLTIRKGKFDAKMKLDSDTKYILQWWIDNIDTQTRQIVIPNPHILLRSDSSDFAWGGVIMDKVDGNPSVRGSTRGSWSEDEKQDHINHKELKAAFFTLQCFCRDIKGIHVKMEIDNTTAISYVNKLGGRIYTLNKLAKQMWEWARDRHIWISAVHIPGHLNVEADAESRDTSQEDKEWMLNPRYFQTINEKWGPFDIDLFATRINTQIEKFISWMADPECFLVNAFSFSWTGINGYAFPPFSLISRVLQKVREDEASITVIAPVWPTQVWYPQILALCVEPPHFLPQKLNLLLLPQNVQQQHHLLPKMKLAAFKLSGVL